MKDGDNGGIMSGLGYHPAYQGKAAESKSCIQAIAAFGPTNSATFDK